jgi:hypothetical protein
MEIKILGTESTKRDYLFTVVQIAVQELGYDNIIIKIEEDQFMNYGTIHYPVFIIDNNIIFEGIVPAISEIKNFIMKFYQK